MTPPVRPQLWRRPQSARPLQVVGFIATRRTDAERGPEIRMRPQEAADRMLTDGELVLVEGHGASSWPCWCSTTRCSAGA
jgi:hypothetical protein